MRGRPFKTEGDEDPFFSKVSKISQQQHSLEYGASSSEINERWSLLFGSDRSVQSIQQISTIEQRLPLKASRQHDSSLLRDSFEEVRRKFPLIVKRSGIREPAAERHDLALSLQQDEAQSLSPGGDGRHIKIVNYETTALAGRRRAHGLLKKKLTNINLIHF